MYMIPNTNFCWWCFWSYDVLEHIDIILLTTEFKIIKKGYMIEALTATVKRKQLQRNHCLRGRQIWFWFCAEVERCTSYGLLYCVRTAQQTSMKGNISNWDSFIGITPNTNRYRYLKARCRNLIKSESEPEENPAFCYEQNPHENMHSTYILLQC